MKHTPHSNLLDTVLTLRGHQITLRQALAEGIIRGCFDCDSGRAEVQGVDPRWVVETDKRLRKA